MPLHCECPDYNDHYYGKLTDFSSNSSFRCLYCNKIIKSINMFISKFIIMITSFSTQTTTATKTTTITAATTASTQCVCLFFPLNYHHHVNRNLMNCFFSLTHTQCIPLSIFHQYHMIAYHFFVICNVSYNITPYHMYFEVYIVPFLYWAHFVFSSSFFYAY